MTERQKDIIWMAALFLLLTILYSKILFTGKIIRAPDIINESYWGVIETKKLGWQEIFAFHNIKAGWNIEINSGTTTEGGNSAIHFLIHLKAINFLIPAPACVAWFIVLHFFAGACGLYLYCRTIACSRVASFLSALVFALAPEMASLINAGHVMKIATIVYAPWAFLCLEKGFLTRRLFWFMATAVVLAIQFFNTHWQIAFYTCLSIGVYSILRIILIWVQKEESELAGIGKLLGLNLVVLVFFLSTVSMSLFPLANWSKDTNRGVHSGANQGKGGLDRDEAMSWSLPPEELGAFIIPGFFGLSRQEAGANPPNIKAYYWGRMVFTQTTSYMGLLPWLLVPLPLLFRRDKYTWLAVIGIAGGILFSMGKYTPFYNLLYDYFPGINRFRVPKMMMFIPVMGLGVMAARGVDLLLDRDVRAAKDFRYYLAGVIALPVALLLLLAGLQAGREKWVSMFIDMLAQPTRYEQGVQLVASRWNNLVIETSLAAGLSALTAAVIVFWEKLRVSVKMLPLILIAIYLGDTWRINNKFLFLVDTPEKGRTTSTPIMEFLARDGKQYRTLPMNGTDPMYYVSNKVPVMFTSNPVQQQRWQDYLDNFSIMSAMPDILNVKYLVYSSEQYAQEKIGLGRKFQPVFQSPDGSEIVLENRTVMPKAWLVPSVIKLDNPNQIIGVLQNPQFDPRRVALVEAPPPLTLLPPEVQPTGVTGDLKVQRYEGEHIDITAEAAINSLLVLGEKYYKGWTARVDGKATPIVPVNYVLRGVYLPTGSHKVEFIFDPLPFKVGKWITLASFALFAVVLVRELKRRDVKA